MRPQSHENRDNLLQTFLVPILVPTTEVLLTFSGPWRKEGVRPAALAFLIKTSAKALRDHPLLNARWVGKTLHLIKDINIGYAVAIPNGLMVPVVRQHIMRAIEAAGLEVSAVSLTLHHGARRDRMFVDENKASASFGKRKRGTTFPCHLEITDLNFRKLFESNLQRIYL